jgi:homoserine dehydrogenase
VFYAGQVLSMLRASLPTVVLKFGSSVLESAASLPIAVAEIYRHYRDGERVIAVVSAFERVTDVLCATAQTLSDDPDPAALAALVSTGEVASAAQLTLALHRAGISAQFVDPREVELTAAGDRSNATLTGVAVDRLTARLGQSSVLVVPGFFAKSEEGGLALLGRGGSDFTALYLANALHAKCVLLKDVDGLYESDPAREGAHPGRFVLANYATALACAGPLVQAKAVSFARDRVLKLEVARVGSARHTRIGEGPTIVSRAPPLRRIRVALLGLGNVGGGVLEYLNHFPERFEVVAALVRTPTRHTDRGVAAAILTDSPAEIFARHPEVLIEALPGVEPARTCLARALKSMMRVVTANKALLAADWGALAPHLAGPQRQIRYSAAVGGSAPMLEAIERLSLRCRIASLRGVLNGTCNFVLDRCATGDSFANAVGRAQSQGLAEADPVEDLSGRDAARKMEILGRMAFGGIPTCEELASVTPDSSPPPETLGQTRTRLVAEAGRTAVGFTYRVTPCALPLTDFLADTRAADNRLEITMSDGRVVTVQGLGAGRVPTATAVFADLLEHARVIEASEPDGGVPTDVGPFRSPDRD